MERANHAELNFLRDEAESSRCQIAHLEDNRTALEEKLAAKGTLREIERERARALERARARARERASEGGSERVSE